MSVRSEMVSYTEPELFVKGSNHISRLFVTVFFFNSAHFSFFLFLSLSRFFLFIFFNIIFSSFIIVFKFISNFQCTNTKWISNFAFASCFCLRIHYITVYFPFAGCICLRICFISFCPRTIWDRYDGWGSSFVAMSRVPVSTTISSVCQMQD